jgi:hypothetical protein
MSALSIFKAELWARHDAELAIVASLEAIGVQMCWHRTNAQTVFTQTTAAAVLKEAFDTLGQKRFDQMLQLISVYKFSETGFEVGALKSDFIRGMMLLVISNEYPFETLQAALKIARTKYNVTATVVTSETRVQAGTTGYARSTYVYKLLAAAARRGAKAL